MPLKLNPQSTRKGRVGLSQVDHTLDPKSQTPGPPQGEGNSSPVDHFGTDPEP